MAGIMPLLSPVVFYHGASSSSARLRFERFAGLFHGEAGARIRLHAWLDHPFNKWIPDLLHSSQTLGRDRRNSRRVHLYFIPCRFGETNPHAPRVCPPFCVLYTIRDNSISTRNSHCKGLLPISWRLSAC